MTIQFDNPERCILATTYDPLFRRELCAALASSFRASMSELLSEDELIGIDYANHFIISRCDSGMCASHFYADSSDIMFSSLASVISGYMEDSLGAGNDLSLSDIHQFASGLTSTGRSQLQSIWNTAWETVMREGFSHLWTRRSSFNDDSGFEVIANLLTREPLDAFSRKAKVPKFPFETHLRDEIKDMTSLLADSIKSFSDDEFEAFCEKAIASVSEKDGDALLDMTDDIARLAELPDSNIRIFGSKI